MARPKATKATQEFINDYKADSDLQSIVKSGLGKFKVVHAVLGYKVGDEFEASHHSVRFQLKHKSIIEI